MKIAIFRDVMPEVQTTLCVISEDCSLQARNATGTNYATQHFYKIVNFSHVIPHVPTILHSISENHTIIFRHITPYAQTILHSTSEDHMLCS